MMLNFGRVLPAEEFEDRSLRLQSFWISESRVRNSKRTADQRFRTYVETRFKSLAAGTPGDKPRAPAAATKLLLYVQCVQPKCLYWRRANPRSGLSIPCQ